MSEIKKLTIDVDVAEFYEKYVDFENSQSYASKSRKCLDTTGTIHHSNLTLTMYGTHTTNLKSSHLK